MANKKNAGQVYGMVLLFLVVVFMAAGAVAAKDNYNVELVGEINLLGFASHIAVVGDYAYIPWGSDFPYGLAIIDISDPANPQEVGNLSLSARSCGICVAAGYAYVVETYTAPYLFELHIIDVNNPTNPSEVGVCEIVRGVDSVAVSGNYAYISYSYYHSSEDHDTGLQVIDISTPSNPTVVKTLSDSDYGLEGTDIAVSGNYLYRVVGGRIFVLDISTPSSPLEIGQVGYCSMGMDSITVQGNYVYAGSGIDLLLYIIDVSNPYAPSLVNNGYRGSNLYDVAVSGKYTYIVGSNLNIIDVSNPSNLLEAGLYASQSYSRAIAVTGDLVYAPTYYSGLKIFRFMGLPISSISLAHGQIDGTQVITGENFASGATVKFGEFEATNVTVDSDTQITATPPAQNYGGAVNVIVTNPDGNWGALTSGYVYEQIYPVADSPKMDGDEFWVDVVFNTTDLFNVSFKFGYDTSALDVIDVEATNGLGDDLVFEYNDNDAAGHVGIGISRKAGDGNTDVVGTIARVEFVSDVAMETVVSFGFSDVYAYQADGTAIDFQSGTTADVTIRIVGEPPTALGANIIDFPTVLCQNTSYSITNKYSDADGDDNLDKLWLTLDNSDSDIKIQAKAGANATNQDTTVIEGSAYVTSATYDRVSSGTEIMVTWNFTLNDTWTESTEIGLIVQCRDDENNSSQADTLDADIDFVIDLDAPANVGLNTPANNATDVPVDTALTILTAADSAVGLADQPYWIEIATDTNFTENFQSSDWIDSTSWTPPTTLTPGTFYYWRVKAKDKLGNESPYCGHTADTQGYGTFTTHNSTPTAPASEITGVPTVIFQDKSYTITSKYSDADGYADLDELWLTFDNGDNDIVFKATADDSGTSIQTTIESGSDYVTSATYNRTSSGNDITINWTFTLNDTWIEFSEIDLIIKCDDGHDAASTPDTLDANITYDNDVEAPTDVGLDTPEEDASAVHTDSTLTVLTATDAGIGLAAQPYVIQLATDIDFTQELQESGWVNSTTFDPDLLPATTYYWRVKAKDQYGNESDYCGHTADQQGYGTFSTAYYVWPGDLDNNGSVNEQDLQPLGDHWGGTGTARARFYQLWNGEPAEPWDAPEMTYVDANGTGVIDEADLLAIGFNWAKTHQVPPQPQVILVATESSPPLTVHADRILKPGDQFTVTVELGDDTRKVEDLFGMSFALQYAQTKFVKATKIQSQDIVGENPLHIDHIDTKTGTIGFAITRKAGQGGVDKNGIVAKIDFELSDKIPLGTPVALSIIRYAVKTADQDQIPLNINSASFVVGYLGDVTLDSIADGQDAASILRHVVGIRSLSRGQQMLADVSDDGTVSAYDVSLILQQLAGIIDRFPQDTGQ